MKPCISIITATYNNGSFLEEACRSVLEQGYQEWEWIIIDNGSTDRTRHILKQLDDPRIRIRRNDVNLGVSMARNQGLSLMEGDYFCFLDGDDMLPKRSLSARLELLESDPEIHFVDGKVIEFNRDLDDLGKVYTPNFTGNPLSKLLSISSDVFKGNTWMIRRALDTNYAFREDLTHGEELLFYIELAAEGDYAYTEEPVLYYRRHQGSAMSNVKALASAYKVLAQEVSKMDHLTQEQVGGFKNICRSIAVRSLLKEGHYLQALRTMFTFSS
jgi:glycosyltransferase involved in cell wall biosynthesis